MRVVADSVGIGRRSASRIVAAVLFVLLVVSCSQALAAESVVDSGFESGADGAAVSAPWTLSGTPQRAEFDGAQAKVGSLSGWIQGPAAASYAGFGETVSGGMASSSAEQRFWVYCDTANEYRVIDDWSATTAERAFSLQLDTAGNVNVYTNRVGVAGYTSATYIPVGTYTAGWTEFRIVYDFATQSYQLSKRTVAGGAWTQMKSSTASTYAIPFRGVNTISQSHGILWRAYNGADLWVDDVRYSDSGMADADVAAPTAPAALVAADVPGDAGGAIALSWTASTDDVGVTGYKVYRGIQSGVYTSSTMVFSGTSYVDTAPVGRTRYYYAVAAVDAVGNESPKSPQATTIAIDNLAPATPTGLTATGGLKTVSLAWNASTASDLAGYNVYRDGAKLNTTPLTATTYADGGRLDATTYSYVVSAVDTTGNESSATAAVSATTDSVALPTTYEATFESGADGAALPSPWVLSGTPQRAEYDSARFKNGALSGWIQGPVAATYAGVGETATAGMTSRGAEQRFWVCFDTNNQYRVIDDWSALTADRAFTIQFDAAGAINVFTNRSGVTGYASAAYTPVGSYSAGWTEFRVVYDFATQTYQLSKRASATDSWTQMKAAGASSYAIPFRGVNTVSRSHGLLVRAYQNANVWIDDLRASDTGIAETGTASGEVVTFVDANLETAVRTSLGISAPTPITKLDMLRVKTLAATNVKNLSGIEYALNLEDLNLVNLYGYEVADCSKLSALTQLKVLKLSDTHMSDPSVLAGMTKLEELSLSYEPNVHNFSFCSNCPNLRVLDAYKCSVDDLSGVQNLSNLTSLALYMNGSFGLEPLAGLTKLESLDIRRNSVSDLRSLAGLTGLSYLNLAENAIQDITPLLANTGLSSGDTVVLDQNKLIVTTGASDLADINVLKARGVNVTYYGQADLAGPAAPTGLTATGGPGFVALSWTASSDPDVYGYKVYRDGVMISPAWSETTNWVDGHVPDLGVHRYTVTAVDYTSNESVDSTAVSCSVDYTAVPAAPTPLSSGFELSADGEALATPWVISGAPKRAEFDNARYKNGAMSAWIQGPADAGCAGVRETASAGMTSNIAEQRFWVYFDTTSQYRLIEDGASDLEDRLMAVMFDATGGIDVLTDRPFQSDYPQSSYTRVGTYSIGWTEFRIVYDFDDWAYRLYKRSSVSDPWTPLKAASATEYGIPTRPLNYTSQTHGLMFSAYNGANMWIDDVRFSNIGIYDSAVSGPSAPTGLSAVGGSKQVTLSWNANSESNLAGYDVYRAGVKVNATPLVGTSYTDTGLPDRASYSYIVRAVDTGGNESAASAAVTATTTASVLPATPALDAGFESGADGSALSSTWTLSGVPQRAEHDSAFAKVGSISGWIKGPATAAYAGAGEKSSAGMTSNGAEQRFWVYFDSANEYRVLDDWSATTADRAFSLQFDSAGSVNVFTNRSGVTGYGSSAYTSVGTYSAGWTEFRIVYDFSTQTYQLAKRSGMTDAWTPMKSASAVGYGIPFRGVNTVTSSHGLLFRAYQNADMWLDDVRFGNLGINDSAVSAGTGSDAPTGVSAVGGSRQITLAWGPSSESDLGAYNVYRAGVLVNPTPLYAASYTDSGLPGGTSYSYTVKAVDILGNESAASPVVTATTTASGSPATPVFEAGFESGTDGSALSSLWALSGTPQNAEYDRTFAKGGSLSAWIHGPGSSYYAGAGETSSTGMTSNGAEKRFWLYFDSTDEFRVVDDWAQGTGDRAFTLEFDLAGRITAFTNRSGVPGYGANDNTEVGRYSIGWTEFRIVHDFTTQTYRLFKRTNATDPWTPLKSASATGYDIPFRGINKVTSSHGTLFRSHLNADMWVDNLRFSDTGIVD